MHDVFKRLARELSEGRPAVLAAIIRQVGSSPRSLGTHCLICRDGALVGSIGGGFSRLKWSKRAWLCWDGTRPTVMEIRLTGEEVAGTDMICGGNLDVLVQAFTPENRDAADVLAMVCRLMERGGRGLLVTGPLPEAGPNAAPAWACIGRTAIWRAV